MVFHKKGSRKKKSIIGRQYKKGRTYSAFSNSLPDGLPLPNDLPNDESHEAEVEFNSKARTDDSWRSNRAVVSQKKALVKEKAKNKDLLTQKDSLKTSLFNSQLKVKQLENARYLDKKETRATTLIAEKTNKVAMRDQSEKFSHELEAAHAETALQTSNLLVAEARRIAREHEHAKSLRTERMFYAKKVQKEKAKLITEQCSHATNIENEQAKIVKQRMIHTTIVDKVEKCWAHKLRGQELKLGERKDNEMAQVMIQMDKKDKMIESLTDANNKR